MTSSGLGKRFRERRKEKGLTLRELGEMSGMHASYLGRIERGERFPSARVLQRLAEPLGFAEVELLKMAGYLARDEADEQVDKVKREVNALLVGVRVEVNAVLTNIQRRVAGL